MKTWLRTGILLYLAFLLTLAAAAQPAGSATIKKRGGEVVTGTIRGLIVQRSPIKASPSSKDPSQTQYMATYDLTNGADITAIDEQGVHKASTDIAFFNVNQDGTPLDDGDVLEAGMGMPSGFMAMAYTKAGGTVIRVAGRSGVSGRTMPNSILGEVRVDPRTRKARLLPVIEVETEHGVIRLSVADVVPFATPAPVPAPEKH